MAATKVQTVSPPSWAPNGGLTIPAGTGFAGKPAAQVAGYRPGRETVFIVNTGANSVLALAADNGQPLSGITIGPGATFGLDTEGAVFIASVAGSTLDVFETFHDLSAERPGSGPLPDFSRVLNTRS